MSCASPLPSRLPRPTPSGSACRTAASASRASTAAVSSRRAKAKDAVPRLPWSFRGSPHDANPGMSRILVVEDEQHIADGLRFNLEAEGHDVTIATDGE